MLHACYSAEYVACVIKVEVLVVNICILQNMKCIFFLWVVHGILFLFSFLIPILLKCDYFDVCWFLIFFFFYIYMQISRMFWACRLCYNIYKSVALFLGLWRGNYILLLPMPCQMPLISLCMRVREWDASKSEIK